MESITRQLQEAREAFERRSWARAHAGLSQAAGTQSLHPDDLRRLALAAFLLGRVEDFERALQDAHHAYLEIGRRVEAVRCAFWLGLHLASGGEMARATGWFGRASRQLEEDGADCVERGYLLVPVGHRQLIGGDYAACTRTAGEAVAIGQRFSDADLLALAIHLKGRALLRLGEVDAGLAHLDEAMIAVIADELTPMVSGLVYCSVIGACREVQALGRAHEWTAALTEWCERQPDMVAYTGECRTYRAELLLRRGEWGQAIEEARRASERFASGSHPNAEGQARYQEGEAHRLQGAFAAAEASYKEASRAGYPPQPGLALLRLAQGDADAALAAVRRVLAETSDRPRRARLLPAYVEILLAVGEVDEARAACAELEQARAACADDVLGTVIAQTRGAVELAAGNASAALPLLRNAWSGWRTLGAPYDAARVRLLVGRACRALGDEDGAELEQDAALAELDRLGTPLVVARLGGVGPEERVAKADHGLTRREREVLSLLATGRTNRAIADALSISEKTVARHVANIFGKLGLSSRAAATAYAYEHGLR